MNNETIEVRETRCEKCVSGETAERRRLNTNYANDEENYLFSCWDCYAELWGYYHNCWTNVDGYWGSPTPPADN